MFQAPYVNFEHMFIQKVAVLTVQRKGNIFKELN